MFNKLKNQAQEKVQKAQDKVSELKQNYEDEQKNKWISEVQLQNKEFKEVQQWFDMYEPKKEKKPETKEESKSSDSAVKKKVIDMMVNSISKNILRTIMECLAYASEFGSKQLQSNEPQFYAFFNSITAMFLTYRFNSKNKKKFTYIRGIAVDRISISLIELIDYEAKKLGKEIDKVDPQQLNQIIDQIVNKAMNEFEKQKQTAIDKFKSSPLFSLSGINDQQVDEGVQMIISTIQMYGEKKIGHLIQQFRTMLPIVLNTITQHQQAIRANLASKANQEPSEEYINKTRNQIAGKIESYRTQLFELIKKFVSGFFTLIDNNTQEEEEQ